MRIIPKLTRSGKWILYDWANSAFALTVLAALFPILFRTVWSVDSPDLTTSRLGFANSIIGLVVAIVSPFIASFSGISGNRKSYLILWSILAILATMTLTFIPSGSWLVALIFFGMARIGFQFSSLFYDAMLIDVTSPRRYHRVSSLGFAFGYVGGAILFGINIMMVQFWQQLRLPSIEFAQRLAFVTVGIWWFIFSLPLWNLSIEKKSSALINREKRIKQTIVRLWETLKFLMSNKNVAVFLLAYWFYIDGVHTVILMAADFGLALGFSSGGLLGALLVVQIIAFPSSLLLGWLAERFRAKPVIAVSILIYIVITGVGGMIMKNSTDFLVFALTTGVVQGGIQALSRSLYCTIIPQERFTELIGIFNMVGRFAMIVGPLLFAIAHKMTIKFEVLHNIPAVRIGMVSLSFLFVIGFILLFSVHEPRKGESLID